MDIEYLLLLQNFREIVGKYLTTFLNFISTIAINYWIVIPALIIFWCVDKKKGAKVLLSHGFSQLIGSFLKVTFCVYRPMIRDSRVVPDESALPEATGYSFPSGHTFSGGGFWNGLMFAFKKKGITIFAVIMMLLIMFSRNYLGVHTPQDVIVGTLLSLVVAFGVCKLLDYIEEHPNKDILLLIICTVACIALLFYITYKGYPMDYDASGNLIVDPTKMAIDGFKDPGRFYGILLGWFIERRFIKFDTNGSTYQKVLRALFGGLAVAAYWLIVANPVGSLFNTGIVYFIMQASVPLFGMTILPLIFKKVESKTNPTK